MSRGRHRRAAVGAGAFRGGPSAIPNGMGERVRRPRMAPDRRFAGMAGHIGVPASLVCRKRRPVWVGKIVVAVVSLLVLGLTGYGWSQYRLLDAGVHRSGALAGEVGSLNGDTNILIMGLDSRLDENGNPLPAAIYDALHAGDANDGGQNANVLMLLHVPHDGGKATSISIPRDDYVDLPGCPYGRCKGKIKQAYGLAFAAAGERLTEQSGAGVDPAQKIQQQRDAGRRAEIDAVHHALGGVPIHHFVEVTLVAFFQIAQVVQPITVCVNEDTQDDYSGANFHRGRQSINATQAVAFVRQRRDYVHPELNFTDLDRERRQQAFIASLIWQLKQGGTLANPAKLQGILDVAKQDIATDSTLNLLSFASQASDLTGGNINFVTLPIDHFGKDPAGEDVNIINVPAIHTLVRQLLGDTTATSPLPPDTPDTNGAPSTPQNNQKVVDTVNANGRNGLATAVERALAAQGFTPGTTSTTVRRLARSVIDYGNGGSAVASQLAGLLGGLPIHHDSTMAAGHLRITLGTDFTLPPPLTTPSATGAPTNPAVPAAPTNGIPDNALNSISDGGIPCIK